MKKAKWLGGIALIIILFAVWIYLKNKDNKGKIILSTEKVGRGMIATTVTATGTVQPVDTVAVGSQVSGIIKAVYADFNQEVKKGQLLAQLDKSLLLAQVQQINANLQAAVANNTYQKSNYDRQTKLYQAGAISKAEMETAKYGYESALANISGIKAQLASAEQNLSYADIYAPADGTILSRAISEGQTVAASLNTPTLFVLAKDLSKMQVNAAIDEADIANVKAGQRVTFSVDAYPSDTFNGTLKEVWLNTTVTSNVVTYTTIIEAPNQNLKLKPGMTASVLIYTSEDVGIMVVPAAALAFTPDSAIAEKYNINGKAPSVNNLQILTKGASTVWILKDSLGIVSKAVKLGKKDETQVEILSGLKEGERIVTGYQLSQEKEAGKAAKSPFMPSRPGGNNKRNQGPPPQ